VLALEDVHWADPTTKLDRIVKSGGDIVEST
jgi:hypothetical protein